MLVFTMAVAVTKSDIGVQGTLRRESRRAR